MDRERNEIKRYLARKNYVTHQRPIKEFPDGGGETTHGCVNLLFGQIFAENERFLSRDALSSPLLINKSPD